MNEFWQMIPWIASSGVAGWLGNVAIRKMDARSTAKLKMIEADVSLDKHRDGLTFEIMDLARVELRTLREEVEKLRPMEATLFHLEQALEHLENLFNADADSRPAAERSAKAFVKRMRREAEARGVMRNQEQVKASTIAMAERDAQSSINGSSSES